VISCAIILPAVVEHFDFPHGRMFYPICHLQFSWNCYNICSLFHFLSSICTYKLNFTTTGNFESTGFTVHEFLSFILVDSLHVFSTCLLRPSPLTKSKFWTWYFYQPTNPTTGVHTTSFLSLASLLWQAVSQNLNNRRETSAPEISRNLYINYLQ